MNVPISVAKIMILIHCKQITGHSTGVPNVPLYPAQQVLIMQTDLIETIRMTGNETVTINNVSESVSMTGANLDGKVAIEIARSVPLPDVLILPDPRTMKTK